MLIDFDHGLFSRAADDAMRVAIIGMCFALLWRLRIVEWQPEVPDGRPRRRFVFHRVHRKVFMVWNRWFAAQLVNQWEFSFGIRLEPTRPLLDVFLGPLTVAVGNHPALTNPELLGRHGCRGLYAGHYPEDAVL